MQIGQKIIVKSINKIQLAANEIINTLQLTGSQNKITCLAFYGEMGAGKTTIIKALCNKLGVKDTTSSPTFAIVNEYIVGTGTPLYHFDFYRLDSESQAFDFGYEEYIYSGEICMIEWPEKIENLLPIPHFKIQIDIDSDNNRIISLFKVTE